MNVSVSVGLAGHAEKQTALVRFTDRLHRATAPSAIHEAALTAMFESLGCDRASILLFDDADTMRFVAWRGLSDGYRKAVEGHSPWRRDDGSAEPICVADIDSSAESDELKAMVRGEGIRGLAFFPLVVDGRLIGKFMTYYDRRHPFRADEIELGLTIARQLAFALSRVRAEEGRRHAEALLLRERELLRTIIDRIPAMVTLRQPNSSVMSLNPEFERVLGWPGKDAPAAAVMERCYPDPAYRGEVERFMETGGEAWKDIRMRTRDGREVETTWATLRLSDGMRVGIGFDITDRKRAEGAREHLAAIVQSSDDGIIGKDLHGVIVSWNQGAERIFGYGPGEAIGRSVTMLIPDERLHEEPQILGRIRSGERVEHYETVRRRRDGKLIDVSLSVSPIKNDKGEVIGASKIARDITERKRAEAQRTLLIDELNHRVKNTLATVISISRQSFANPNTEEARRAFDSRIRGLAQTHSRLSEASWAGVRLDTILADELGPYRGDDGSNVRFEGPVVTLSPKAALLLGLALHELATNAAKHGALSTKSGLVRVTWRLDPTDRTLRLEWVESGGPRVSPPQRSGFGRLLLERALTSDLKCDVGLDFAPPGLRCAVALPISEHVVALQ